jgi:hypothetical protein
MKRIVLMVVVAAGLLVPSSVLVSSAGAKDQHPDGNSPGQGGAPSGDTSATCGGSSGGKPTGNCSSKGLPFSDGCQHGQAPNQNPHCEGTQETATTTSPVTSTPAATAPAGGAAGAENKGANNKLAASAAQGGSGGKLPFTGLETLWLSLLGAGMLASGLALRARSGSSRSSWPGTIGS